MQATVLEGAQFAVHPDDDGSSVADRDAPIKVAAFLLFRGRVELLGGLVAVQIQIEASGSLSRSGSPAQTDVAAQVTFALDISIFLVINISFSQSWQ